MEQHDPVVPKDILDDYWKRAFSRYETASTHFQRLMIGLNGFALIFFFLVLFPYVSMQRTNRNVRQRLSDLEPQIHVRTGRIDGHRNAQQAIIKLREQIQRGPSDLRDLIEELQREATFAGERPGGPLQIQQTPSIAIQQPLPPDRCPL